MARYTLNNPMPGHYPTVGRVPTGSTWGGGRTYGTTISCSCGKLVPHKITHTHPDGTVTVRPDYKISNVAPSKGGRTRAQSYYRSHLAELAELAARDARIEAETFR
jgi:hypothetical protein